MKDWPLCDYTSRFCLDAEQLCQCASCQAWGTMIRRMFFGHGPSGAQDAPRQSSEHTLLQLAQEFERMIDDNWELPEESVMFEGATGDWFLAWYKSFKREIRRGGAQDAPAHVEPPFYNAETGYVEDVREGAQDAPAIDRALRSQDAGCQCVCHKVGLLGFMCCLCTTRIFRSVADEGGNNVAIRSTVSHVPEQRVEVGQEGQARNQRRDPVHSVRDDPRTEARTVGVDSVEGAQDAPPPQCCEKYPMPLQGYSGHEIVFCQREKGHDGAHMAKSSLLELSWPQDAPTTLHCSGCIELAKELAHAVFCMERSCKRCNEQAARFEWSEPQDAPQPQSKEWGPVRAKSQAKEK